MTRAAPDVDASAPDTANYQAQPYGYGPTPTANDPYSEWRGGRFIPAGTVYQTTPQWTESAGPYSIGPFSSEYEPPYMDYAFVQFDLPPLPASIAGAVPSDVGDNAALFESYANQYGSISAPALPTGPSGSNASACK